jgi:hypothetical protein
VDNFNLCGQTAPAISKMLILGISMPLSPANLLMGNFFCTGSLRRVADPANPLQFPTEGELVKILKGLASFVWQLKAKRTNLVTNSGMWTPLFLFLAS